MAELIEVLVIGAGPAGLMAALELARAGRRVVVAEAKPSPARKFLMAGKSGLNITKDEAAERFLAAYDRPDRLAPILAAFGPEAVREFCAGFGVETFAGSSGRVFPKGMKASPLLRAWLRELTRLGAEMRVGWRWMGFDGPALHFATEEGPRLLQADRVVLAMGGASWARLGSDGAWAKVLAAEGFSVTPFQPANMGFAVNWSPHMARHFGQALKGVALRAGSSVSRGEVVISARGIEGGGIYALSRALRDGAALTLDLAPDLDDAALIARLARIKTSESRANALRKLGFGPVATALVQEWGRDLPLVTVLRALPARLTGPRPLDEAISVAGGLGWDEVGPDLQLLSRPGTFVAGEMLDWEAPTGGYLLTACLAMGRWAGRAAAGLPPSDDGVTS